jgi:uncharacterized membrane protein
VANAPSGIGKHRVEALADGVFSIAMTLLVLNIQVPDLAAPDVPQLPAALLALWPKLAVYAASFLVIGVFWVGHHAQLHFVRHADRPFLWMNVVFLPLVSAVPFSASLLGRYPGEGTAALVYALHLAATGAVLLLQFEYAARRGLFSAHVDARFVRAARRRLATGPVLYLAAAAAAFVSTALSLGLCLAVVAVYLLPGAVDAHWRKDGPPA